MRRLVSLVVWWALLVCLWTLYVGTTTWIEVVAGLGAAAIAAVGAEVLRSQGLLEFTIERRLLARAWKVPVQLVFEFALLTWILVRSLARGKRVEGELLWVPFDVGTGTAGRWGRAWETVLTTMTPNAIVVDVDTSERRMLLHTLAPRRWQGSSPV